MSPESQDHRDYQTVLESIALQELRAKLEKRSRLSRQKRRDSIMGITEDPNDPALTHGVDNEPVQMAEKYLVLSDKERSRGFVRPLRTSYVHAQELGGCGASTTMGLAIAQTYARDPTFYGATFCMRCSKHRPVGEHGEFVWDDGSKVGT